MPLYEVKNNRARGSWSIITAGRTHTTPHGQSRQFEMSEAEARNGEAEGIEIKRVGEAEKAAPETDEKPEADELAAVRAEYEEAVGKKPYHGWSIAELREKMAEAKD